PPTRPTPPPPPTPSLHDALPISHAAGVAEDATQHHTPQQRFEPAGRRDVGTRRLDQYAVAHARRARRLAGATVETQIHVLAELGDRKSTRLNSSHGSISYAVFCF